MHQYNIAIRRLLYSRGWIFQKQHVFLTVMFMDGPGMVFEIRTAVPDDASAVCNVLRRSIAECCVADHRAEPDILENWLGNKTPDNIASWIVATSNYTLVAVRAGEVVGVALLTQAGKLSLCYVVPEALHKGIGKAMLQQIEQQASVWGISVLRLHGTASARAFFAGNGYISAGKEMSCFGVECDFFWKKLNVDTTADCNKPQRFCNCSAQ